MTGFWIEAQAKPVLTCLILIPDLFGKILIGFHESILAGTNRTPHPFRCLVPILFQGQKVNGGFLLAETTYSSTA